MANTYGVRVNPSQKPILSPEKLNQMSIENLNSDEKNHVNSAVQYGSKGQDQNLAEYIDFQLTHDRKKHVKQKRAKKVIEAQINKEKIMLVRKYESVTALSQDKNMSTQRKVFYCKNRHAEFPPSFWLNKHKKQKSVEQQADRIKRKLRALSKTEFPRKVLNISSKELLSPKGGLNHDGSEIALQFYQIQDQLPPRGVLD